MAKRNDLLKEVARASEALRESGEPAPVSNRLDAARRKRQAGRRAEAMSMKLAGLTHEQIGERLGISASGAREMIFRTLRGAENLAAEQQREIEGARLDRAQAAIWTKVLSGDEKAIDTFLRISARRARLFGLDAPTSLSVAVEVRAEMVSALESLEKVVLGEVLSSVDEPYPADEQG